MPVPKGVDPEKYDRCVDEVKDKGSADNAYAVCASSLKRSEVDWSKTDIQKNIGEFNSMVLQKKHIGWAKMVSHLKQQGHSQASAERIAGSINAKYVHHYPGRK